jgi:hypothetical protein
LIYPNSAKRVKRRVGKVIEVFEYPIGKNIAEIAVLGVEWFKLIIERLYLILKIAILIVDALYFNG